MEAFSIQDIKDAATRIAPYIRRTPFLPFDHLGRMLGKEVWLKCEMLQRTGSFKIRGATNCILMNMAQAKAKGVVAASAGNHAQGVAAICQDLGIKSTIVMPKPTPPIKVENTRRFGAAVELVGSVYDESHAHAREISQKTGAIFIHPFNDVHIAAGQGTVGLEMLSEKAFDDVEALVVSIGGGGLATGIARAVRAVRPKMKIYGITAKNSPSTWLSFQKKSLVESDVTFTLAEGVATKRPDEEMLKVLHECLDDMFAISEESIATAIALLAEHGKMCAEGAGALPIAALIENLVKEKKVALVVSGGNIDLAAMTSVLQRGLALQNRLMRLSVTISDRPGGLHAVTQVLAETGANIHQVFHERSHAHHKFGEAGVELDLETRGQDHATQIVSALEKRGFQVQRV